VRPSIAAFVWSVGLLLPPAVSAQVAIAGSEPGLLTRLPAAFALTDTKLAAGDLLAGTPSNTSPDGGTSATAPRRFTVQEATEPLPTPWTLNVQPTYTANNGGGSTSYLQLQPILTFDLGLRLALRFEWPIPKVDQEESGPVVAGIGDLTWLSVLFLGESAGGGRSAWARYSCFQRPRTRSSWAKANTRSDRQSIT